MSNCFLNEQKENNNLPPTLTLKPSPPVSPVIALQCHTVFTHHTVYIMQKTLVADQ